MKQQVIFATGNRGKVREIEQILPEYEILTMAEAGVTKEIIENGSSFKENALIKARAVAEEVKDAVVLADDSGFEVDALGKKPGVYSSRFLGEDTPYETKNAAILKELKDVPKEKRTARFICAIAAVFPDGTELLTQAEMEGEVAYEAAGNGGFGYDPIFFLPEKGCTSAELSPEEKNAISHRGKALREMAACLRERQK